MSDTYWEDYDDDADAELRYHRRAREVVCRCMGASHGPNCPMLEPGPEPQVFADDSDGDAAREAARDPHLARAEVDRTIWPPRKVLPLPPEEPPGEVPW